MIILLLLLFIYAAHKGRFLILIGYANKFSLLM